MNSKQAMRAIRNIVRLENLADETASPIRRRLREIFREVGEQVRAIDNELGNLIPDEPEQPAPSLFRVARWRTIEAQLRAMLEPVNDEFYERLVDRLSKEIPRQVEEAEKMLEAAGIKPYQRASVTSAGTGDVVNAPGIVSNLRPNGDTNVGPAITRTQVQQVVKMAEDVEVLNTPISRLFASTSPSPPRRQWMRFRDNPNLELGSAFINSQINIINKVVQRGFLIGETNKEIARRLGSEGAARSAREADTIARTAVMQTAADAHQAFYDENENIEEELPDGTVQTRSVIAGYEYDGTMDSRVCMICAPWDGRTAVKRKDLPPVVQHPNCRCMVYPLTESALLRRQRYGPERRSVIELYEVDSREEALELARKKPNTVEARAPSKQIKVNGKMYWQVSRDIQQPDHPLTMGEFLAQATEPTRERVLGSKKRARRFMKMIAKGDSQDSALRRVTDFRYRWSNEFRGRSRAERDTRGPAVRDLGGLR